MRLIVGLMASVLLAFLTLHGCSEEKSKQEQEQVTITQQVAVKVDIEAGKNIAQQCFNCHEQQTVQISDAPPFISGQQEEYIKNALHAYKDSKRGNVHMKKVVAELNDQNIIDVAAYLSKLNPNWNIKEINIKAESEKKIALLTKKEAAIAPCRHCHGEDGNGVYAGMPSLAGLQEIYLIDAMKAYKSKRRTEEMMKVYADPLSNTQIQKFAKYYSVQTPINNKKVRKGNVSKGRRTAQKKCDGCHGKNGYSDNPIIPSLAGQDDVYFIKALKGYKNGERKDEIMEFVANSLSNNEIDDLAAYYVKQKPKKYLPFEETTSQKFDPLGDGKKLAGMCGACHGMDGVSVQKGVPNLAGLHLEYLIFATKEYKQGSRPHSTMAYMVKYLSDLEIEKISLYFASIKPKDKKVESVVDTNSKKFKKLISSCVGCHGQFGVSTDSKVPSLAGQDKRYLISAIKDYATDKRKHDIMKDSVKALPKEDVELLATFFSAQNIGIANFTQPNEPLELAKKCDRCHGENGYSRQSNTPRLAGQLKSHLYKAMNQYKGGRRESTTMHAMMGVLSLTEITAMANYYSNQ